MPGTHDFAHEEKPEGPSPDPVSDVVRWAAFSCALVPVVLLMCGQSFGGAAGTAAGLVALTCVCHGLLRQSERTAAKVSAEQASPHRGRHGRTGGGSHRGARRQGPGSPAD
ncbi:hypothetical protein [Streptomyces sp. NPDC037389]|uniref:hypothetical protein n=1 Tax=Streptomyces sp. NPDC037389 TaxID=3155369 RepID=UPI0033F7CA15